MNPTTRRFERPLAAAAILAILAAASLPARAQVTAYDHVPSADEILSALKTPKSSPAGPADAGAAQKPGGIQIHSRGLAKRPAQPAGGASTGEQVAAAVPGPAPAGNLGPAIALPVVFDSGSARIAATSMSFIEAMVTVLEKDPTLRLVIEGHTDGVGNPRANIMLSWERAFSVFKVMVERYNIDPMRLQPMGKGATEPLEDKAPTDGANRRVQFRVMG